MLSCPWESTKNDGSISDQKELFSCRNTSLWILLLSFNFKLERHSKKSILMPKPDSPIQFNQALSNITLDPHQIVDKGSQSSRPWKIQVLYRSQVDVSPLIQENSSVLTNGEGELLVNPAWECPCRVVKEVCELWVSESLGPLVCHLSNWPLSGFLKLGEPRCEQLLNCLGRECCKWVIRNVRRPPPLVKDSHSSLT